MSLTHLLIALAALLSSVQASAENRLLRCAKYMLTRHSEHSVPSLSSAYTKTALSELHLFRAQNLNEFDYSASNQPVVASEASSWRQQQAVTSRISGVLADQRGAIGNEGVRQVLVGSMIEGYDNILAELEAREQLVREIQTSLGESYKVDQIGRYVFYPSISLGSLFLLSSVATMDMNVVSEGLALWYIAAYRTVHESWVRALGMNVSTTRAEVSLRSALEEPGRWHYGSFDQKMPLRVMENIWRTGNVEQPYYWDFSRQFERPELTLRAFSKRMLMIPVAKDKAPAGWLRVDELLSWNGDVPRLTVVLRMAEQLPVYPTRQTMRESQREVEGQTVPLPIRVR